jgi:hypothetical protein
MTYQSLFVRKSECGDAKEDELLEWVPEGLNTGALSGAKASSSRTRDTIKEKSISLRSILSRQEYALSAFYPE